MVDGLDCEVLVVGAGISGIGAGIALLDKGLSGFIVLEKADEVGGTWRDHTYPGLTVDVPVLMYSRDSVDFTNDVIAVLNKPGRPSSVTMPSTSPAAGTSATPKKP